MENYRDYLASQFKESAGDWKASFLGESTEVLLNQLSFLPKQNRFEDVS